VWRQVSSGGARLGGHPPQAGLVLFLLLLSRGELAAQTWNDSTTLALVQRGVVARRAAEPDSALRSYHTRAHGFVFFLAQVGDELAGSPRLIKADELDVDVFWRAPGVSRQVIVAWRDGRWLPTDISYHRDHLGIVTNNFGDRIRIGEGDEVRDVVHPLSPDGPALYDYRLRDSLRLERRDTTLDIYEVDVRPRDAGQPLVIGTLSLDARSGDLVRFRFSFTPSAYLDRSLEDISVVLENAQLDGRWWLPWRQEIEIRRRLTWLDFPARSIIRGRWVIGDYDLNVAVPAPVMAGSAIGGLRTPVDTGGPWTRPLAEVIGGVAAPVQQRDLDAVRADIDRLAEGRFLTGLPRARLGLSSVSDLAHVNRVQGLALGAGFEFEPAPDVFLRPRAGIGTADGRLTADLRFSWEPAWGRLSLVAGRRLSDIADRPIASSLVNSLLAQEGGRDLGDYALVDQATLGLDWPSGSNDRFAFSAGVERSRSVSSEAAPARGAYRPNPALGAGTVGVLRFTAGRRVQSLDRGRDLAIELRLEAGQGDREYERAAGDLRWLQPAGPGALALRLEAGVGTAGLPAYRSFAIGGWGTLPGEGFRRWGGRRMALAWLEYRVAVPFPAIPLGAFVSTGSSITIAPFVAAGVAGGPIGSVPWRPTREVRPVVGGAIEWFHRLLRTEVGVSLRTGQVGVTVDVSREWWGVL
jgi:hypothetical protein